MLDLFNIAKPQGCDIQTFYGAATSSRFTTYTWNKPRGVSHIYMLLIGAGGDGDGASGGGSGAVTVWYGAAQHVPDSLVLAIGGQSDGTTVYYKNSVNGTSLLKANASVGSSGGGASSANYFAASGFFQSVAGQTGTGAAIPASTTTFLSAGSNGSSVDITANYGYDNTATNGKGYFQMQPIIVGVGAPGSGNGGLGCGGGGLGLGGQGMILIASW